MAGFEEAAAVGTADAAVKNKFTVTDIRISADRGGASSHQGPQKIPLYSRAYFRFGMIQGGGGISNESIFFPANNHNSALRRGRQHPVQDDGIGGPQADTFQSSGGEDSPVPGGGGQLLKPRIHVAPEIFDMVMRIAVQPLGAAAYAAGSDHGGGCVFQEGHILFIHQQVVYRSSFQHGGLYDARGRLGGYVFHGMHRHVDMIV